jgi:hypothetical protein
LDLKSISRPTTGVPHQKSSAAFTVPSFNDNTNDTNDDETKFEHNSDFDVKSIININETTDDDNNDIIIISNNTKKSEEKSKKKALITQESDNDDDNSDDNYNFTTDDDEDANYYDKKEYTYFDNQIIYEDKDWDTDLEGKITSSFSIFQLKIKLKFKKRTQSLQISTKLIKMFTGMFAVNSNWYLVATF